ncbi:C40 family peptidase [Actinorugispora endophytica]|uniref:Transglycosylase protein with SLT domain n=1 Tax=Actinorugispora endophytica TaxID=1605990 RepID=A0A4R6V5Y3_9ACTN|nr:NlpC/P60 family protein [Actinorugispora endophytica]TDQ54391.1 transglycosylase protein with SLT domain [Actinorugispora endophytica]
MAKAAIAATAALLLLPVLLGAVAGTTSARTTSSGPAHVDGIPDVLLDAYLRAAARLNSLEPGCTGMTWAILAGIGRVESTHAAGHDIAAHGDVEPPFTGPRLDGSGVGGNLTPHYDTDNGRWDGDTTYDRAVGVTQHLPANWARYGRDGNGDGAADPHNAYDSVLSTAVELCASGGSSVDFTDRAQLDAALYRYNPSRDYVDHVLEWIDAYTALPPATVGGGEGSDAGRAAAEWALAQVGKPYLWGGTGPNAFDCSGLTMRAWQAAGVDIPRVTTDQVRTGTPVGLDELAPGDLLFYDTGSGPAPSHVTMYVGGGQMVNAPSTGNPVRVEPVRSDYYSPRFTQARRPA